MQSIIDEDSEEIEQVSEKETHTSTKEFLKRLDYLTGVREQSEKLVGLVQTHKEYMEHTVRYGHIDVCDSCQLWLVGNARIPADIPSLSTIAPALRANWRTSVGTTCGYESSSTRWTAASAT